MGFFGFGKKKKPEDRKERVTRTMDLVAQALKKIKEDGIKDGRFSYKTLVYDVLEYVAITPSDYIGTAAVCRNERLMAWEVLVSTDITELRDMEFMLIHEASHIIFNHFSMTEEEQAKYSDQTACNIAMDAQLNSYILDDYIKTKVAPIKSPEPFKGFSGLNRIEEHKHWMDMYDEALKMLKNQPKIAIIIQGAGSGNGNGQNQQSGDNGNNNSQSNNNSGGGQNGGNQNTGGQNNNGQNSNGQTSNQGNNQQTGMNGQSGQNGGQGQNSGGQGQDGNNMQGGGGQSGNSSGQGGGSSQGGNSGGNQSGNSGGSQGNNGSGQGQGGNGQGSNGSSQGQGGNSQGGGQNSGNGNQGQGGNNHGNGNGGQNGNNQGNNQNGQNGQGQGNGSGDGNGQDKITVLLTTDLNKSGINDNSSTGNPDIDAIIDKLTKEGLAKIAQDIKKNNGNSGNGNGSGSGGKKAGSGAAEVKIIVDDLIQNSLTHEQLWRKTIQRYLTGMYTKSNTRRHTYARPNRRFGESLPGSVRNIDKGKLGVLVDCSGSMCDTVKRAISDTAAISSCVGGIDHLVFWNTELQAEYKNVKKSNLQKISCYGCGGTMLTRGLRMLAKEDISLLILLTDLELWGDCDDGTNDFVTIETISKQIPVVIGTYDNGNYNFNSPNVHIIDLDKEELGENRIRD